MQSMMFSATFAREERGDRGRWRFGKENRRTPTDFGFPLTLWFPAIRFLSFFLLFLVGLVVVSIQTTKS